MTNESCGENYGGIKVKAGTCEACVWGRGKHAEGCEHWLVKTLRSTLSDEHMADLRRQHQRAVFSGDRSGQIRKGWEVAYPGWSTPWCRLLTDAEIWGRHPMTPKPLSIPRLNNVFKKQS